MRRTSVTYGQLDKVLRSLGFNRRPAKGKPPARVYEHVQTGAMVILPEFDDEDFVFEHHLVAARSEADNFGLADPSVFTERLQKAG